MTKQEAIEILRDTPIDIRCTREDDIHTLYATAQGMAIEALQGKDTNVPSNDSISRQRVLEMLEANRKTLFYTENGCEYLKRSIFSMPSAQPEKSTTEEKSQLVEEKSTRKLIYLDEAIDALRYAQHRFTVADEAGGMGTVKWSEYVINFAAAERVLTDLPSAQPDNRLAKIADLVEGTIDHFNLEDAMDLLYQIKDVLK